MIEHFTVSWSVDDIVENWNVSAEDAESILMDHESEIWDASYDAIITKISEIIDDKERT